MHASAKLLALAGLAARLCLGLEASRSGALAARDGQDAFQTVDPTVPWVTVDDEGQPVKTVTPSMAVVSGTSSVVDGAPHDLTASVFTWTSWGTATTSTGTPPNPTATKAATGEGAFSRCVNRDGDHAPFCRPLLNSTLFTGSTYYITWDPDFYNRSAVPGNATYEVAVRLDYRNHSNNEMVMLDTLDRVPARWGFSLLKVHDGLLMGTRLNNVTITLLSSWQGSSEKNRSVALPVALARPSLDHSPPPEPPRAATLLIALPLSLGAFFLILVGLFLWHRQTRRIQLGNIMGRARRRYTGRRHRRRLFGASAKDHAIQLDAAPLRPSPESSPPPADYRDAPDMTRPRRDSDALGSLAGSPVHATFGDRGTADAARNVFRDELRRQEKKRRDDDDN